MTKRDDWRLDPAHPVAVMRPLYCGVCGNPLELVEHLDMRDPFRDMKLACHVCQVFTYAPVLERVARRVLQ